MAFFLFHCSIFIIAGLLFVTVLDVLANKLEQEYYNNKHTMLESSTHYNDAFIFTDSYIKDNVLLSTVIKKAVRNKIKSDDCLELYAPELIPMFIQYNKRAYKQCVEAEEFPDNISPASNYNTYMYNNTKPSPAKLKEGIRIGILRQISFTYSETYVDVLQKRLHYLIVTGVTLFCLIWPFAQWFALGHITF